MTHIMQPLLINKRNHTSAQKSLQMPPSFYGLHRVLAFAGPSTSTKLCPWKEIQKIAHTAVSLSDLLPENA